MALQCEAHLIEGSECVNHRDRKAAFLLSTVSEVVKKKNALHSFSLPRPAIGSFEILKRAMFVSVDTRMRIKYLSVLSMKPPPLEMNASSLKNKHAFEEAP